jgi:hypothetical protein
MQVNDDMTTNENKNPNDILEEEEKRQPLCQQE